jgi:DNA-binding CsgD family transcriptional regulator
LESLVSPTGTWVVIRAAALTTGSGAAAGHAVTLGAAAADDLAPLLMRAWGLTPREREVARLVIDGLSTQDIATALFISAHTVRDHLKTMFGKMGVSRRPDLAAVLAGRAPASARAALLPPAAVTSVAPFLARTGPIVSASNERWESRRGRSSPIRST